MSIRTEWMHYQSKDVQLISGNLIDSLFQYLPVQNRIFILTDENVGALYLNRIKPMFKNSRELILPPGETSKTFRMLEEVLGFLTEGNAEKSDVLLALGGGVITDLGAFASSIYKRGMKLVLMPTSLLAQIDSAIGGKTGVDFEFQNHIYKNLVGTIYHPDLILIDSDFLKTLPEKEYLSGLGEAVKYGLCFDKELFEMLHEPYSVLDIINRSIAIKGRICQTDEFENKERLALNYGHTVGHAIESISHFSVPHGIAVASGMLFETKDEEIFNRLKNLYSILNIPIVTDYSISDLIPYILQDKKRRFGKLFVPILHEIGTVTIESYEIEDYLRRLS